MKRRQRSDKPETGGNSAIKRRWRPFKKSWTQYCIGHDIDVAQGWRRKGERRIKPGKDKERGGKSKWTAIKRQMKNKL
jgi:hypothetical protein